MHLITQTWTPVTVSFESLHRPKKSKLHGIRCDSPWVAVQALTNGLEDTLLQHGLIASQRSYSAWDVVDSVMEIFFESVNTVYIYLLISFNA